MIGDDICITIVSSRKQGLEVRVGIEAPWEVPVHREEVYQKIKRQIERERRDNEKE